MNNNLQDIHLFIGVLLEEDHARNFMRITRRQLRDAMNPFQMPPERFVHLFRLNQQTTINLIHSLEPHMPHHGISAIPLEIKVLTTLHFLAVGSFQNSVGTSTWLSVSQTSVSRSIEEVCNAVVDVLLPVWIRFPSTEEEKNRVKQGFYRKFGFRGVLGAIDGTHVDIIAPPSTDDDHPPFVYINRKGKHSINVMLISDAYTKILACNARFPGSVHDAAIWQQSQIRNYLRTKFEEGDRASHLIGDSGYPLEPWLFTPVLNPRNEHEESYNTALSSARNVIERTNGVLKGRWRCISRQRTLLYHPTKAAKIVYTCCILHNIALDAGLGIHEDEIELPDEVHYENDPPVLNDVLQRGREARNEYILNNFV